MGLTPNECMGLTPNYESVSLLMSDELVGLTPNLTSYMHVAIRFPAFVPI